ncbi:MAG: polysaccharide deacetylase family protein [Rhizobiaceae bacterium]|nr:polysaccharide deacetylase family protein [Rhizobiaceae bacterium]
MKAKLALTRAELERWRDQNLVLPLWWRDDDAVEPTPALERLLSIAGRFEAPIHLAVVAEPATSDLSERLRLTRGVFVLTHGWKHANHAPADQKKAEFGSHRPLPVMLDEMASGRERLAAMFGEIALPAFVPPWNRIAPAVTDRLGTAGFRALSAFTPRGAPFAAKGVLQINTHLDPVAWKSGGGLLDPQMLDTQLARELAARRTGVADNAEPYGILTHHLVHDDATWDFTEVLLETFAESGTARWTPLQKEIV